LPYLDPSTLSADEAIRRSYGQIDLSYSVSRYSELAAVADMTLAAETDITANTLPTYAFLQKCIESSPLPEEVGMFARATGRLKKASRKGLLGCKILLFNKARSLRAGIASAQRNR